MAFMGGVPIRYLELVVYITASYQSRSWTKILLLLTLQLDDWRLPRLRRKSFEAD